MGSEAWELFGELRSGSGSGPGFAGLWFRDVERGLGGPLFGVPL